MKYIFNFIYNNMQCNIQIMIITLYFVILYFWKAMYKTRNTGTGNGMRGTRGMGKMLYSGECPQTFRIMLLNILGNVTKHSGECHQIFRGMSPNIPGNVAKYSGECPQTFRVMLLNILGSLTKHSG